MRETQKSLLLTCMAKNIWSGRQDLNLRPRHPERRALPDCATSRGIQSKYKYTTWLVFKTVGLFSFHLLTIINCITRMYDHGITFRKSFKNLCG